MYENNPYAFTAHESGEVQDPRSDADFGRILLALFRSRKLVLCLGVMLFLKILLGLAAALLPLIGLLRTASLMGGTGLPVFLIVFISGSLIVQAIQMVAVVFLFRLAGSIKQAEKSLGVAAVASTQEILLTYWKVALAVVIAELLLTGTSVSMSLSGWLLAF
ncbi:MAG: hypothetical protein JNM43_27560 [Planctomycetaceae bacterium]|nr:hypothetical protein [Planctomycetaceae bacterium]